MIERLHPSKTREAVTIVMIAFDQYSAFPGSVDTVLRETLHPIKLILIEGGAPEHIRHELEKRNKKYKDIKIIYSAHRPRMAEAFNLALAHIRTTHVFLMHNNLRVTPGWLHTLMESAKHKNGIVCPYITHRAIDRASKAPSNYPITFSQTYIKEACEIDMHGFLAPAQLLQELGGFDESVSTGLVGISLGYWLHMKGIPVHRDPYTVMHYRPPTSFKGADLKLLKHQWGGSMAYPSMDHLKQKWDPRLDEEKYLEWLDQKRGPAPQKSTAPKFSGFEERSFEPPFPKLGFKKFIQVLHRA